MEMVDIKKLETAILYIQRIVNGNNPVNNMPLEDDAVLNNQNVTRCMSFVKDVLEEVKKNDGYIGRKPRILKIDFPIQKLDSFEYKSDKTITKFVEQLNEMIDTSVHTKISYKIITDWLKENDYLKREYNTEIETPATYPTEKGKNIGITAYKEKNNRGLEYIRIIYGEAAQKFIVKNMDQIINANILNR